MFAGARIGVSAHTESKLQQVPARAAAGCDVTTPTEQQRRWRAILGRRDGPAHRKGGLDREPPQQRACEPHSRLAGQQD